MFNVFGKSDMQIEKDVINELKWDPSFNSSNVSVGCKNGIVTLRGSVPHFMEKMTVEQAAHRVGGVRAVADEVEVDLLGSYERQDEDIARAAASALEWGYSTPKDVQITVVKGWVTLEGETDWNYKRQAAHDAVKGLMGVRGVSNNISIKSGQKPGDIKERIEEALKRSAESEGRKIKVEIESDTVTLSGNVHSFSEYEDAGFAAWSAPGIKKVKNNLHVAQ